jgi:hypothetical protein
LRGSIQVASPEDVILGKLEWYHQSQGILEKQWRDILGILAAAPGLDFAYLRSWSDELGVRELLDKAIEQVRPLQ